MSAISPLSGPSASSSAMDRANANADWERERRKERNRRRILKIVLYAILVAAALSYLTPFFLSAISMFKSDPDISKNPMKFSFSRALGSPSLDGLRGLRQDTINFPRWMLNSVYVTTVVVLGRLVIASLAGYALSRMKFPGQRLIFSLMLLLMGIPGIVLIIPQFIVMKQLGILNTYWGIMIPLLIDTADIIVMKQFMEQIPREMEESAAIDGASRLQTFRTIILPMAAPGLLTLVILRTNGVWNEFMKVLIATPSAPQLRTLPVGLATLQGEFGTSTPWATMLAGALLTTIPMAIMFFVFQKHFRQGLSSGAVKG
jgi:multiple sugar transport system permease protein